jgi:glycine/D-amino acid oxidase-like deaminating enzyme
VRLNIYPAKGYSVALPTEGHQWRAGHSLTDDELKLVYSIWAIGRAVVGTAELSGYSRSLNRPRCHVKKLFPRAGCFDAATVWSGLRPTRAVNVPYVGRTHYRNLWLNTGHCTLGWTLGAGSGFRIAEMLTAAKAWCWCKRSVSRPSRSAIVSARAPDAGGRTSCLRFRPCLPRASPQRRPQSLSPFRSAPRSP